MRTCRAKRENKGKVPKEPEKKLLYEFTKKAKKNCEPHGKQSTVNIFFNKRA
jgi:hypothetical protein